MTYAEKLKDPRWQRKRLEIMSAVDFTCQGCGSKESELHIHHTFYVRGKDPWEYPDYFLKCFCSSCHELYATLCSEISTLICCLSVDQAGIFVSAVIRSFSVNEIDAPSAKLLMVAAAAASTQSVNAMLMDALCPNSTPESSSKS